MSARGARGRSPVVNPVISGEKLGLIRSGKKKKTVTGFKENKNITYSTDQGKFVVKQKEKKFEETGVTKKKRNFIEFESKLGTERAIDTTKIGGPTRHRDIEPRVEERIIQKRKKKEYLDNYQYHETKDFKDKDTKPSIVIHQRLGNIYGATVEEVQTIRTTQNVRPSSSGKNRDNLKQAMKQNRSVSTLRGRPSAPASATGTKTTTTTTRVGRRTSGPSGPATTTNQTKTTTRTTTSRVGGETQTKTKTTTTTTKGGETKTRTTSRTTRGRK